MSIPSVLFLMLGEQQYMYYTINLSTMQELIWTDVMSVLAGCPGVFLAAQGTAKIKWRNCGSLGVWARPARPVRQEGRWRPTNING